MTEENKGKNKDIVRPANALGDLSKRSASLRVNVVIIGVIGFIALAFIGGALFRSVTGGVNTPEIPTVGI